MAAKRFLGKALKGVSGISCAGVRLNNAYALAAWKRSAKKMANWLLAIAHSLGGIFHLRTRCTKSFRLVSRLENEAVLDRMAARLAARRDILDQRPESVEHPFGTIKTL